MFLSPNAKEYPMPLIQGGPPEWVWKRNANLLESQVTAVLDAAGQPVHELHIRSGLEALRIQFLTDEELREFAAQIAAAAGLRSNPVPSHALQSALSCPQNNRHCRS
jgi:hypothetical protein